MRGGAAVSAGTGNLVHVLGSSTASFTADGETLTGNLIADATSTLAVALQNGTTLTGSAQRAAMTLDSSSTWVVTGSSILATLADAGGISALTITNIVGNGHAVYYDSNLAANAYLGGLTYALVEGGVLTPSSNSAITETSWSAVKESYRGR